MKLSYGDISALAGDYYGTYTPISNGETSEKRRKLFLDAWKTLAENREDQPADAHSILQNLAKEQRAIDKGAQHGEESSEVYGKQSELDDPETLQAMTHKGKKRNRSDLPALASRNVDHFGEDACKTYEAGHEAAMHQAIQDKTEKNLLLAYAMNAFADHFLQDLFSAGHFRTPRRLLHGSGHITSVQLEQGHELRFPKSSSCRSLRRRLVLQGNSHLSLGVRLYLWLELVHAR